MSTSPTSRPSPLDVQALLAEFDASGQSAAAFARSRGIRTWRIYHALNRRSGKRRSRKSSPALVPVHVVESKPAVQGAPLELVLAHGHRLLIGPEFDPDLLRRVLEALAPC